MARLDQDGDGALTPEDPAFRTLLLWLDANKNGETEPGELHQLWSFGIERIGVDYRESAQKDRHGNQLRYRSEVRVGEGPERLLPGERFKTSAVDVFLRVGDGPPVRRRPGLTRCPRCRSFAANFHNQEGSASAPCGVPWPGPIPGIGNRCGERGDHDG